MSNENITEWNTHSTVIREIISTVKEHCEKELQNFVHFFTY